MTEDTNPTPALPVWDEVAWKNECDEPLSALEKFVLDNEPGGDEDEAAFRTGLAAVLREVSRQTLMPAATERCSSCDDTGHVSSITGEWYGRCHCEAGRTAPPMFAETAPESALGPIDRNAARIVKTLVRVGEDPRVFGLTMSERTDVLTAANIIAKKNGLSLDGEHG